MSSYTPDDADPDDSWLRRRRKQKAAAANRRLLVGVGVGAAVLVALGLMVALSVRTRHRAEAALAEAKAADRSGDPGVPFNGGLPTPAAEGERWTHADLADYLRSRGSRFRMNPHGRDAVALYFGPKGDDAAATHFFNARDFKSADAVLVVREDSPEAARGEAAALPGESFAWGRFVILGPPRLLSPIHVALTGRPFRSNP